MEAAWTSDMSVSYLGTIWLRNTGEPDLKFHIRKTHKSLINNKNYVTKKLKED